MRKGLIFLKWSALALIERRRLLPPHLKYTQCLIDRGIFFLRSFFIISAYKVQIVRCLKQFFCKASQWFFFFSLAAQFSYILVKEWYYQQVSEPSTPDLQHKKKTNRNSWQRSHHPCKWLTKEKFTEKWLKTYRFSISFFFFHSALKDQQSCYGLTSAISSLQNLMASACLAAGKVPVKAEFAAAATVG